MFILRGLFWFAIVALLMPQGPDLGLNGRLDHLRDTLSSQQEQLYPAGAVAGLRRQVASAQAASTDFIGVWRRAVGSRLDLVRADLVADRAARSGKLAELIVLPPSLRP